MSCFDANLKLLDTNIRVFHIYDVPQQYLSTVTLFVIEKAIPSNRFIDSSTPFKGRHGQKHGKKGLLQKSKQNTTFGGLIFRDPQKF